MQQPRNFMQLLADRWSEGHFVCVGLDPDPKKIPPHIIPRFEHDMIPAHSDRYTGIVNFCKAIVDATHDKVCAFKPNSAFFEALGDEGHSALDAVINHIHGVAPTVPVICDAKRGDIGNTNDGYVKSSFELLKADAITVSPYMGGESLLPFRQDENKGVIVLCRTSNSCAGEFQDLEVTLGDFGVPLYQYVAQRVANHWNSRGNHALVVGATCPEELKAVRDIVGDMPILIPGIGAQGGDIEKTVKAGKNSKGQGMIVNLSRSVLYASNGHDFATAARAEVERVTAEIQKHL